MKTFLSFIFIIIISLTTSGGCGNNGEDCDFSINTMLNGQSIEDQISFWDCIDPNDDLFTFVIFADGSGVATNTGPFEWENFGCRSITVYTNFGRADAVEIESTVKELSFLLASNVEILDGVSVNCVLMIE